MASIINSEVIEEIRARVDIVEIIREKVDIKKAGGLFKGRCPFHNEKTPSFTVNPAHQSYKCYGCGEGGDVFSFLQKNEGLTFVEAVRKLAERVGVTIVEKQDKSAGKRKMLYKLHAELADFYSRCLKQTKGAAAARDYLASRQIDQHIIDDFMIGFAPPEPHDAIMRWAQKHGYSNDDLQAAGVVLPPFEGRTEWYDRFQNRLIFPIRDTLGRVIAFSARVYGTGGNKRQAKYVNSPETEIFTKGRVLYGLDHAASKIVKNPRREALICEGQIDVIRCHAAGFETAVASQGTAFSKEHAKLLKRYADCAVLVFDGDAAGCKAAVRTGALLLEESIPVRVARLSPKDDPDSVILTKGHKTFQELIDRSLSIAAFQIESWRDHEKQPISIDAVNRITHGIFETLVGCSSSVLRSSLLQEASDMLNLPVSALENDFNDFREKQKHYAATSMRRHNGTRHSDKQHALAQRSDADYDDGHTDESPPLTDGPDIPGFDEFEDVEDFPHEHIVDINQTKPDRPPCKCEKMLCEILVEHEHDLPIINLIIEHLPLDIITHDFARKFVKAVIESNRQGVDKLAEMYKGVDATFKPLFNSLLNHQHKMLGAVEATPEEATQDIIRRIWITHYREEQGKLPSESTPENDMRRLQLSCLIKQIETGLWEDVRKLLITTSQPLSILPNEDESQFKPEGLREAATSLYVTDNASAYSHQDESQPSEYPPDEILDL